jgi:UDP-4-amino-4,6-dideoxy-N-acetyl-beta-L-altrosamine transaminase
MIPYGKHFLESDDIDAVIGVLKGGSLTQGPTVDAFEREIADYVGAKFAVAVSSGTAALHLAAMAAGLGPESTLITSPVTFVASANAALYVGANVAFADIDPNTINMSPSSLRVTLDAHPNTRAIVPVHFGGLPCDMLEIKAIADSAGAVVIEDAAHALGAIYPDGARVGSCAHSLMTMFSFHPVKLIAAGEGGMITTNDEMIYRRLIRLRSHGINKLDDSFIEIEQSITNGMPNPWYYEMQELGFHYRITDIQCALGLSQFKKIERFISRRIQLARKYDMVFSGRKTFRPAQPISGDGRSGHHLYVLRINFAELGTSRADYMNGLKKSGIITQVHYMPVPMQPYYRRLGFRPECYPNAVNYYNEALSIPLYYGLTDLEQEFVIEKLNLK